MAASKDTIRVLVVGRTPPPFLGAPIMLEFLLRTPMPGVEVRHLQLTLSNERDQGGQFAWKKLVRMASFILRMWWLRVTFRPHVLYYTPELVKPKTTVLRDAAILAVTRWCFPRTVLHLHASGHRAVYEQLSKWQKWLVRKGFFHADGVIRLSRLTPEDAQFLEARREFIVPNGIADPYEGMSSQQGIVANTANAPLQILFVSLLCEPKGLCVLIDACGKLAERGVPFELSLMGPFESEEFAARVRARVAELQIADRVSCLGTLTGDEKFRVYSQSDVLCHPTYYDTFPLVILEAMAAALPVVATTHSGIPDIVDDGETGFLVPPRDISAVAERLAELACDADLRRNMGAAGRQKFVRRYTLGRHVEGVRGVLLEVAGGVPAMAKSVTNSESKAEPAAAELVAV